MPENADELETREGQKEFICEDCANGYCAGKFHNEWCTCTCNEPENIADERAGDSNR